jgi:hypothetical protein
MKATSLVSEGSFTLFDGAVRGTGHWQKGTECAVIVVPGSTVSDAERVYSYQEGSGYRYK